jgi:hypothetical protein
VAEALTTVHVLPLMVTVIRDALVGRLVPVMVTSVFFGPPITPLAVVTWVTDAGAGGGVLLSPPFLQEKKNPVKNRKVKNAVVIFIDNFFLPTLEYAVFGEAAYKGL